MTAKHAQHQNQPGPRLIAWEVTRSCPLACKHCRAAARHTPYPGELTTDEGRRLLENIASFARPTMILTGGEPMLRPDIYDLAGHAHRLGLPVVMAPCGLLIDDESARKMIAAGIQAISISLDGATAESHDAFRGVAGRLRRRLARAWRPRGGRAWRSRSTRPSRGTTWRSCRRSSTWRSAWAPPSSTRSCWCPPAAARNWPRRRSRPRSTSGRLHWLADQAAEKTSGSA